MTFYELSTVAALSATFAVICVYFFLFSLYRHSYIGLWVVFWIVYFGSQFIYRTPLHQLPMSFLVGLELISTANYVLLVFATSQFLGRKMHKGWYYWALGVTVLSNIGTISDAPFIVKALPCILFIAYVNFWHGWMFIRCLDSKGWGKNIVGMAFIGTGIHAIDMPFLMSVNWFAPWGFLISSALRFIISIGTLMLYVEKNFRELVIKEKQYRLLAENAADTIYHYRLRPQRGFEYISPSVLKLTGYTPEEYYESPDLLFSLVYPNDAFLVDWLTRDPVSGASRPLVMRFLRRDHTVVWAEQTTVPIFDKDGLCTGFEGIIRDISLRKQLEQDVARLDRLSVVGQMAANLAHEIRNPMTIVQGYLQFLRKKSDLSHYQEHFNLLLGELGRANSIITEYLGLCKNKSRNMKVCQLNDIIQEMYPLLKASANAACIDVCYSPQSIPNIRLDEKEVRQLILNLVRNGLEAMESGGTITLRTYVTDSEVALEIQDQGKGIPPDVIENLGKPFLTTKENGTGLGLAIVYRIANEHQAKVQVKSGPEGTTFTIIFRTA